MAPVRYHEGRLSPEDRLDRAEAGSTLAPSVFRRGEARRHAVGLVRSQHPARTPIDPGSGALMMSRKASEEWMAIMNDGWIVLPITVPKYGRQDLLSVTLIGNAPQYHRRERVNPGAWVGPFDWSSSWPAR